MLSAVCSALNNAHNDEDDDHHMMKMLITMVMMQIMRILDLHCCVAL